MINPQPKKHEIMEIEITSLIGLNAFDLSHSQFEGGNMAGRNTWQSSIEQVDETPLLDTPDKLQTMRDFTREHGGWSRDEIAAWSDREVNALFLQWVAGDTRQCPRILDGITFEERDGEGWFHSSENEPDMETGPFESLSEAYEDASPCHGYLAADSLDEIDWQVTEAFQHEGNASSYLFRADDGKIYFTLSN